MKTTLIKEIISVFDIIYKKCTKIIHPVIFILKNIVLGRQKEVKVLEKNFLKQKTISKNYEQVKVIIRSEYLNSIFLTNDREFNELEKIVEYLLDNSFDDSLVRLYINLEIIYTVNGEIITRENIITSTNELLYKKESRRVIIYKLKNLFLNILLIYNNIQIINVWYTSKKYKI